MGLWHRIRDRGARLRRALTPSPPAWRGAANGVYAVFLVAVGAFFLFSVLHDFTWQKLPAFLMLLALLVLVGLAAVLIAALVMRLPRTYRLALAICAPFVLVLAFPGDEAGRVVSGATLLLLASLIGGGIAAIRLANPQRPRPVAGMAVLIFGLIGCAWGLYAIFSEKPPANPALEGFVLDDRTLPLPNPGLPGDYPVRTLTYGTGTDRHRPEFGEDADLIAPTVDGSKLIERWEGFSGWLRTTYWGFDVTELPLQARVWYPDGDGPFPLVLVVHGNHSMEEYSDPGYDYLGELLASRGIILASVDENFINFAVSDFVDILSDTQGLQEENDARGWLLLEHLALWRDWADEPENPFFGRVDIDRVALIGHSRGGEAVGVAAAFNSLERYPDDASVEFDYGFNLRGVIAIAPVYGQYQPRERPTPIRDVNYFTIHGSLDADVQSFEGLAQYARVALSGDDHRFRSGLYVVGANHGQFNTVWGNIDTWLYDAWALDLGSLMEPEAQRDVARVFFSAFLEIVLNDRREYLPIFRDARYATAWLPETFFINQFSDTGDRVLADFDEDIDPATMTLPGGRIVGEHLSRWYETRNSLKSDDLDTHAVVVAWDPEFSDRTARIDFRLPSPVTGDRLVASLSAIDVDTMPPDWTGDEKDEKQDGTDPDSEDVDPVPLDWTIELTDSSGQRASLPLSHDSVLYPLINATPRRASFLEPDEPTEVLFRRFELPLQAFADGDGDFDPTSIVRISFVFDRSERGVIIVDELSLASPPAR